MEAGEKQEGYELYVGALEKWPGPLSQGFDVVDEVSNEVVSRVDLTPAGRTKFRIEALDEEWVHIKVTREGQGARSVWVQKTTNMKLFRAAIQCVAIPVYQLVASGGEPKGHAL